MSYHDDNDGDNIDICLDGASAAVMGSTVGVQSASTTGTTSDLMSSKRNPEFILSVLLSLW